ncbi:MAG: hypothetical protein JJU02_17100, partial [Cryomorphaceae bacterium]|nr:hypothetical protein [Cryomorphaceae bacterium]
EADWLMEYQQTLRQVLTQATESNQHMDITEMDQFAANIRQAYIDVLGNQADIEAFENGYRMAATRDVRAKETDSQADPVVQDIIRESDTPEQALELLDELLASRDLDKSQRLEAINTREFLVFLAENSELITNLRETQVRAKGLGTLANEETTCQVEELHYDEETNSTVVIIVVTTDCNDNGGWWNTWGRCATGILGGAATGTALGCGSFGGVGFLIGGVHGAATGCALGIIVGGIGGAATGAVASC